MQPSLILNWSSGDYINFGWRRNWVECERNDQDFLEFIQQVLELLEQPQIPEHNPECEWCKRDIWSQKQAKIRLLSPPEDLNLVRFKNQVSNLADDQAQLYQYCWQVARTEFSELVAQENQVEAIANILFRQFREKVS